MLPKVHGIVRLTRDVEVRYSQGGSAVANTAIATSRKFKSQTGEQKEEVLFVDLNFFGRSAELATMIAKFLKEATE